MIRLQIENKNGKFDLVLKEDTNIRFEHNSPLFQTDVIPGSRSYSFGIPINDLNRQYLMFPEQILFNGKVKVYNCNYYFWNKLFTSGKLLILRTNTEYQAQLSANSFAVDFKKLKITDVINQEIQMAFPVYYANYVISRNYEQFPLFQFPEIYNDKFYDGSEIANDRFENILNKYDVDNATFEENEYVIATDINENRTTLVPQPYLFYVFSELFKNLSYDIKGEFTIDDRIKKLLIYNNFPLDKFNDALQGLNTFKSYFNINQLLPDMSISEFLNALKDFFQLGIFFDHVNKKILFVYKKSIVNSSKYFDIDPYAPDNVEVDLSHGDGYELSYAFNNDEYAKLISVDLSEEETTDVDLFNDLFPYHGQNDKIFYVRSTAQYFRSKDSARVDAWQRLSDKFYPITKGEGKYKVALKLSPLLTSNKLVNFTGNMPIIRQTGSSDAFINGRNQPGLKLMIWHGQQPDINNKLYPFASATNINSKGDKIADFTLLLDGEEGIFNTFHKDWIEFVSDADKIRVIAFLPVEAYFSLMDVFSSEEDSARKIRYRGINFIPERISAMHKMNSDLVETEIIMHKKASEKIRFSDQPDLPVQDFLEIIPSYVNIGSPGNISVDVWINTLSAWTAVSNDSFITLVKASGNGTAEMQFSVAANSSVDARQGTITVTNAVTSKTFSVNQEGKLLPPTTTLEVNPDRISAAWPTSVELINITCNTNWAASSDKAWATIASGDESGTGNGTMQIVIDTNPTTIARTAHINVVAETLNATVTINQEAGTGEV